MSTFKSVAAGVLATLSVCLVVYYLIQRDLGDPRPELGRFSIDPFETESEYYYYFSPRDHGNRPVA